jgi:hypothetical protein
LGIRRFRTGNVWKFSYFIEIVDPHLVVIVEKRMMGPQAAFMGALLLGAAVPDEVSRAETAATGFRFVDSRSFGMDVQFFELGTVAEVMSRVFAERTGWSLPRCGPGVCKLGGVALIVFLLADVFRNRVLVKDLRVGPRRSGGR